MSSFSFSFIKSAGSLDKTSEPAFLMLIGQIQLLVVDCLKAVESLYSKQVSLSNEHLIICFPCSSGPTYESNSVAPVIFEYRVKI